MKQIDHVIGIIIIKANKLISFEVIYATLICQEPYYNDSLY